MSKKTLSERIALRAKEKKHSIGARNRAVFLSLKTDIQEALNDGWSINQIWETLTEEGKIDFGYQSFRRNVHRTFTGKVNKELEEKATSTPQKKNDDDKVMGKKPSNGFSFNSQPDKKDLY